MALQYLCHIPRLGDSLHFLEGFDSEVHWKGQSEAAIEGHVDEWEIAVMRSNYKSSTPEMLLSRP